MFDCPRCGELLKLDVQVTAAEFERNEIAYYDPDGLITTLAELDKHARENFVMMEENNGNAQAQS